MLVALGVVAVATRLVDTAPATLPVATAKSTTRAVRVCDVRTPYGRAFRAAARETGLPLTLLVAVAWEESRMDPHAESAVGAQGLLQLMPATARELRLDGDDPETNVLAGARYLKQMIDRFGSLDLALAAYNAGPTAVERAGGAPTVATLRYAKNIEARAVLLSGC
jgi:soluble lytic murein transglycosylase-like protein